MGYEIRSHVIYIIQYYRFECSAHLRFSVNPAGIDDETMHPKKDQQSVGQIQFNLEKNRW